MGKDSGSPLTPDEMEHFRLLLVRRRAEIVGDVERLKGDLKSIKSAAETASQGDPGAESYARSLTGDLAQREQNLLQTIDHALGRIADGTYGICEVSGEPISRGRLEAKPWARTTIEVAQKQEREGGP